MRDHIAAQASTFEQIIAAPDFTKYFTVGETALKNVPRGYAPGHPQAEFLKYKRWYLEYPIADAMLWHVDFASEAAEIFKKCSLSIRF